jgi:hypothetical protein
MVRKLMQLSDLKDTQSGRIFILGTGPSLTRIPSWEGIAPTFGCNKLGYWDKAPLTDFYACNYSKVLKGEVPDPQPRKHKFLVGMKDSLDEKRYLEWPDWVWLTRGVDVMDTFGAMTLVCAQIARTLGFQEIYLLGCDQTERGSIFDKDDDRLKDQLPGVVFPDTLGWWRRFAHDFEGVIWDCTKDGNLNQVLPYKPLEEVLNKH